MSVIFETLQQNVTLSNIELIKMLHDTDRWQRSCEYYESHVAHEGAQIFNDARFMCYADLAGVALEFQTLVAQAQQSSRGRTGFVSDEQILEIFSMDVATPVSRFAKYEASISTLHMRLETGAWISRRLPAPLTKEQLSLVISRLWPGQFVAETACANKAANQLLTAMTFAPDPAAEDLHIQFADSVLTSRGLVDLDDEINALPPSYVLERNALPYASGELAASVTPVDELLRFICNDDLATLERFLDLEAMVFVLDSSLKEKLGKISFMHGFGANGKSLRLRLLRNALSDSHGHKLATDFDFAHFVKFGTAPVIGSLALIDEDCSGKQLSKDVVSNLKKASNGGTLQVEDKHQKAINVKSAVSLIACGNELPLSDDKSEGWLRRFELYYVANRLSDQRPQHWFDAIRSEAAAEYYFSILLTRALRIIRDGELAPLSEAMLQELDAYTIENSSVNRWLDSIDWEKDILYHRQRDVYKRYKEWCGEDETVFKANSFRRQLKMRRPIDVKLVRLRRGDCPDEVFDRLALGTNDETRENSEETVASDLSEIRVQVWVKLDVEQLESDDELNDATDDALASDDSDHESLQSELGEIDDQSEDK